MAGVKAIPDDYPRIIPSLAVADAAAAIEFYCAVFGATVRIRIDGEDGRVGHAELALGDSVLMLADEYPTIGFLGPRSIGGTPVTIMVFMEDADAVIAQAIAAGATSLRPIETHFYGDRSGQIEDPFGHRWIVATHVEDVSTAEMVERARTMSEES